MSKPKAMLNSVSGTGGPPRLEISEQQWDKLFLLYGESPSAEARHQVIEYCGEYLIWKKVENAAQPVRELDTYLKSVEKVVEQFSSFAYGSLLPRDDAGKTLENIIDDELRKIPLPIENDEIFDISHRGAEIRENEPETIDIATLSVNQLMHIGIGISVAVKNARKHVDSLLGDRRRGWQPGRSFDDWLLKMRDWAMENDFQRGPFRNGAHGSNEPSSFSEFVFAINGLFPERYRDSVNSESALAYRLRTLLRRRHRHEGE